MVDLSDTDTYLEFVFEGGVRLQGRINRIHGPLLVEEIKSRLPIHGRCALLRGEMKIPLGIGKGYSKPTSEAKRGDIAYMPLGDSLCIYLQDTKTFSKINVLGKIASDESALDQISSVRRGSEVVIRESQGKS
ncbi:hypothetical protein EU545_01865 [Candidatus Thorarchaeota archaeon]|jgi:hypothetical protein|nr:MAG: hypothetical protein EU545_01865 [Candidatus Thorarchaeota archaeon]